MSLRTVSVRVNDQNPARVGHVSYDNTVNVKVDAAKDYKVKSASFAVNKLVNLQDVYAISPIDGDTLVFNSVTGKYVSKKIDSSQINITNIDAGTF